MLAALRKPKPAADAAAQAAVFPQAQAAQDWLPIRDLHSGLLHRPDGGVVGGVRIEPLSLLLKSDREVQAIIGAVHAAVNGLQVPWQVLSLYRPVDLDAYLNSLSTLQVDSRRRQVLRAYRGWVEGQVRGGETVERRYYLLVTRTGQEALAEHRQHLPALATDLARARGLQARVMRDADWREALFLAFHAEQAAVESVPSGPIRLAPIYRGGVSSGD